MMNKFFRHGDLSLEKEKVYIYPQKKGEKGKKRKELEKKHKEGRMYNLLLTASHSFRSSPVGSLTASLKFPLPSVASICFLS